MEENTREAVARRGRLRAARAGLALASALVLAACGNDPGAAVLPPTVTPTPSPTGVDAPTPTPTDSPGATGSPSPTASASPTASPSPAGPEGPGLPADADQFLERWTAFVTTAEPGPGIDALPTSLGEPVSVRDRPGGGTIRRYELASGRLVVEVGENRRGRLAGATLVAPPAADSATAREIAALLVGAMKASVSLLHPRYDRAETAALVRTLIREQGRQISSNGILHEVTVAGGETTVTLVVEA